jgi:putative tricarboxylic transport membrane protein
VILGLILGPMMELQFRRACCSPTTTSRFVRRPLTATLLALAVVAVIVPYLPRIIGRLRGRRTARLAFGEDD